MVEGVATIQKFVPAIVQAWLPHLQLSDLELVLPVPVLLVGLVMETPHMTKNMSTY